MGILLELFLQIFGEFALDILLHLLPSSARDRNIYFGILGYSLLGAVVGALTLFVFPDHLIRSSGLQIANLIVTPLLVAALMAQIGAMRRRRDKRVVRLEEFIYAYATALTFAVVRFFGAS